MHPPAMNALNHLERFIFSWSRARFLTAIFVAMVVKTGIWHIPNLDSSARIAQNPFILWEPRPSEQYIFTSWLGPFVAWVIGARNEALFLLLHLVFALLFTATVVWLVFARLKEDQARLAIIVFVCLPASANPYFWSGNDGLTLLLFAAALALRERPIGAGAVGVLIGLQHFEQGMFGFAALAAASWATPRFGGPTVFPWRSAAATLIGILVGKALLMLIFKLNGMAVVGREGWLLEHLPEMLTQFWFRSQYILFTALGLGWLVALRYADNGRAALPFFICLLGLLPLVVIVNDQTRVIGNVTFPLLFAFWLTNAHFLGGVERREAAALLLIWLVVPWSWAFEGLPTWSVLPYDLVYAANKLFGWFHVPDTFVSMWPFRRR